MKTYRAVSAWMLVAATAALVFTGPASAQRQHEFDIQGGQGGGFFKVFCPPGNFMLGLRGKAGVVIDNLQLFCGPFRTVPSSQGVKNWRRTSDLPFPVGNTVGDSGGGTALQRLCGGHNFVRGIEFNTARFLGRDLVAFVKMSCEHDALGTFQLLNFGFNFPPGFPSTQKQICPRGQWAIGLKGRHGERVDALALLCSEMPPF